MPLKENKPISYKIKREIWTLSPRKLKISRYWINAVRNKWCIFHWNPFKYSDISLVVRFILNGNIFKNANLFKLKLNLYRLSNNVAYCPLTESSIRDPLHKKQSGGWMEICGCYEMIYADSHVRYVESQSWSLSRQPEEIRSDDRSSIIQVCLWLSTSRLRSRSANGALKII